MKKVTSCIWNGYVMKIARQISLKAIWSFLNRNQSWCFGLQNWFCFKLCVDQGCYFKFLLKVELDFLPLKLQ